MTIGHKLFLQEEKLAKKSSSAVFEIDPLGTWILSIAIEVYLCSAIDHDKPELTKRLI